MIRINDGNWFLGSFLCHFQAGAFNFLHHIDVDGNIGASLVDESVCLTKPDWRLRLAIDKDGSSWSLRSSGSCCGSVTDSRCLFQFRNSKLQIGNQLQLRLIAGRFGSRTGGAFEEITFSFNAHLFLDRLSQFSFQFGVLHAQATQLTAFTSVHGSSGSRRRASICSRSIATTRSAQIQNFCFKRSDLLLQLPDFKSSISTRFFIQLKTIFDVFGSSSVSERIQGFREIVTWRRGTGNHQSLRVSTQRVLKQSSQFRITIGNVRSFSAFIAKGRNYISQRQQARIDANRFFGTVTTSISALQTLRSSQINKMKLAAQHGSTFFYTLPQ